MALGTLIVTDPRRRCAAITDLRQHDVELAEASDRRTARQILRSGLRFKLVITGATLPDGTWCDMLRDLRAVSANARFLVSADRHDELLCGDVVARGGYYAVTPPHEWKLLRYVIGQTQDQAPGGTSPRWN